MGSCNSSMEEAGASTPGNAPDHTERRSGSGLYERRSGISAPPPLVFHDGGRDNDTPRIVVPKSHGTKLQIERAIKGNILFSNVSKYERLELFDAMIERQVEAGEVIIHQGDDGDNFYVVDRGHFEVTIWNAATGAEEAVNSYTAGGHFGELALLYNCPRAATVRATTEARLWQIDRNTYARLMQSKTHRRQNLYKSFLESVPILESLTRYERSKVAEVLEEATFADGEYVIRQGEMGDCFFIILEGVCIVTKTREPGSSSAHSRRQSRAVGGPGNSRRRQQTTRTRAVAGARERRRRRGGRPGRIGGRTAGRPRPSRWEEGANEDDFGSSTNAVRASRRRGLGPGQAVAAIRGSRNSIATAAIFDSSSDSKTTTTSGAGSSDSGGGASDTERISTRRRGAWRALGDDNNCDEEETAEYGGGEEEVNIYASGDYFGELALLSNRPRAANVIARGRTTCVFLDATSFTSLLGPLDDILKRNMLRYDQYAITT